MGSHWLLLDVAKAFDRLRRDKVPAMLQERLPAHMAQELECWRDLMTDCRILLCQAASIKTEPYLPKSMVMVPSTETVQYLGTLDPWGAFLWPWEPLE